MNNEYLFCRDQIPTQGTKGALVRAMMREKCTEGRSFAQICAKNAKCTATIEGVWVRGDSPEKCTEGGLLFLGTDVLFHGFGGDGSGGFEGVSGLDAGGGGGDGSPSLAGRDTEGEGDQEERHDD